MRALSAVIAIVICVACFYMGRWTVARQLARYSRGGVETVWIDRRKPVIGIPIVEFEDALSKLKSNRPDEAAQDLEAFLDFAIEEAKFRRGSLSPDEQRELDKALAKAARYRSRFPRPPTGSKNYDEADPTLKIPYYWTREKQAEIDVFLKQFLTNPFGK